jgi:hypothetical protein
MHAISVPTLGGEGVPPPPQGTGGGASRLSSGHL